MDSAMLSPISSPISALLNFELHADDTRSWVNPKQMATAKI
jgi:hypothetical protein